MADTLAVKQAIAELLRGDANIRQLLGKDRSGKTPVYIGFYESKKMHLPCITVDDVSEVGEVSGLADGFNEASVSEWETLVCQVDCWAPTAEKRDQIATQVKKTILQCKNVLRSNGVLLIQQPTTTNIDELDIVPPVYRKSIRYRIFYVLEVTV